MPKECYITPSSFDDLMSGVCYKPNQLTIDEIKQVLESLDISYDKKMKKGELLSLIPKDYIVDKMEWNKTSSGVVKQLVLDILGVERIEKSGSMPTIRGLELESEARRLFSSYINKDIIVPDEPYYSLDVERVCGSIDGYIKDSRVGIEIKCPTDQWKHLQNIVSMSKHISEYYWQMQGYIWLCDFDGIYFISYGGQEFPEDKQLAFEFVGKHDKNVTLLEKRIKQAINKSNEIIAAIDSKEEDIKDIDYFFVQSSKLKDGKLQEDVKDYE